MKRSDLSLDLCNLYRGVDKPPRSRRMDDRFLSSVRLATASARRFFNGVDMPAQAGTDTNEKQRDPSAGQVLVFRGVPGCGAAERRFFVGARLPTVRVLALAVLSAALSQAAIDGTIINATTGKPQPNATVTLFKVGGNGPESLESVKSGPDGKFLITAEAQGQGPRLVQAAFDGAVYNHMIPPGFPASGITINVYQSSAKPGAAHVEQHMMLLEPDGQNVTVSESYVFKNDGKVTYNDPTNGTLRFWLPAAAQGKAEINVLSPGSVPVRRAPQKTAQANIMKLDFPVLPGESRVDISYAIPFTSPGDFDVRTFYPGNSTKLVAPVGVTMKAEGMKNLGQEPRTKATIYGIDTPAVTVQVEGTGALNRQEADSGGSGDSGQQNTLMQILPRLYQDADPTGGFAAAVLSVKWILLLAFGILGLGFVLLYRKAAL